MGNNLVKPGIWKPKQWARGRKRIYANDAERQWACRKRKRDAAERAELTDAILETMKKNQPRPSSRARRHEVFAANARQLRALAEGLAEASLNQVGAYADVLVPKNELGRRINGDWIGKLSNEINTSAAVMDLATTDNALRGVRRVVPRGAPPPDVERDDDG